MSESESQTSQQQPTNDAAAPSDISEGERIRRSLVERIEAGDDLRDRDQRIRACHEVEKELGVPYGNVSKQVKSALIMAAKNSGEPPESFKRTVGGSAEVTVKTPKKVTAEEPPAGAGSTPEGQPLEQAKPAKPKMSEIYAAAADPDELRKTLEYRWMRKSLEVGLTFIEGTYHKIGILADTETLIPKEQNEMMLDMSVQMCMKYDWALPERIEKMIFLGSWGMLIVMPPLAKLGVLDGIKDGSLFKKKKPDPKQSDKPLADSKVKV